MKGVAVRLSYKEETEDTNDNTHPQQIGRQIQQLAINTTTTGASRQIWVTLESVSTPILGVMSQGLTFAASGDVGKSSPPSRFCSGHLIQNEERVDTTQTPEETLAAETVTREGRTWEELKGVGSPFAGLLGTGITTLRLPI
ncbi:hypothetical protein L1987_18431 [Smallanthus sonchifolius]|uniref:Uncharacterized protein n=1 Tax=Smallanthus sonchifolius TaxID=185202 RepID=A0ACB9J1Q3_9ASTR|nr:hypothetical protein L1987_18431 [Smallanthus sonchifolius]